MAASNATVEGGKIDEPSTRSANDSIALAHAHSVDRSRTVVSVRATSSARFNPLMQLMNVLAFSTIDR
jgi:hypothetical protein